MKKGKFITFEGGDGTGKSTQVRLLSEKLSSIGLEVVTTREPGGTALGEELRTLLKSSISSDIDPLTECFLMFAARREHFTKVIKPNIDAGKIVISDRFYDSTLVYQGSLKSVSHEDIMHIKHITLGTFEPDLTIILDMPSEAAIARIKGRNKHASNKCEQTTDAYDQMNLEKHNAVRNAFLKIADTFSFRTHVINASHNINKISDKILQEVLKKI